MPEGDAPAWIQQRLDLALESAQVGLWDLDLTKDVAFRTLRHDQIFGYPSLQAQWGYEIFLAHVVPEDRPAVKESFEKAFNTSIFAMECRITRKDDHSVRWISAQGRVFRNPSGNPIRMMGTVADVTERKRVTEEYDLFFRTTLELIAIADLDGYFKRVNPSWERTLGWRSDELLSRPWLDFVHPDDREATVQAAQRLASGAVVICFENRYRSTDGSYRWLSWSVPAPAAGSSTLYCTARDVTELKVAEARILGLNEELEAFSYSVSHDLRSPLRHINGFVNLLHKHAEATLDDQGRRYLRTISDAANRMGQLIDDLLAFSRTGRVELRQASVSMSHLVQEVRRDLKADEQGRTILWDLKPLPEAHGDPALLRQVWVNLLSNAVKYTRNRPDARIEVGTTSLNGQGTAYYVRDNGAGFDMKYVGKLFGVFQRLHSAQEFEGTGVGLANVKRIITRHGGQIWAEGQVGQGATFYFMIPPAGEDRR